MNKLKEIIRYFLVFSMQPHKLTKTKVTKLVYLSDWFYAIYNNEQLTNIRWYFDHYGPYVSDVYLAAMKDPKIEINYGFNTFGNPKETLKCSITKKNYKTSLKESEIKILNEVLSVTDSMNWREFIDYVYDTTPIKINQKYSKLDLVSFADLK